MCGQVHQLHIALGDHRIPHHAAAVAQAACGGLTGFELACHLQRHGLLAFGLDIFGLHLQATELHPHRARRHAVKKHHMAFVQLEIAHAQLPRGRRFGGSGLRGCRFVGRRSRDRRGSRISGLEPALKHPMPVRIAAHAAAGLLQQHFAHGGGAGLGVQPHIAYLQQLELGHVARAGVAGDVRSCRCRSRTRRSRRAHQGHIPQSQLLHHGGLALAIPRHAELGVGLATQAGHQIRRHIAGDQPQPEVRHAQRRGAAGHGALALQAEGGSLRLGGIGRQGLQARLEVQAGGLRHGPLHMGHGSVRLAQAQAGGGGGGLVRPIHRGIAQRQGVELHAPGGGSCRWSVFCAASARSACGSSYLFRSIFLDNRSRQQVQLAIGGLHHVELRRLELHGGELHAALQRAHIGQAHLQAVGSEQRLARRVLHRDAAHGDRAGQRDGRLRVLHKADFQGRIDHRALRLHRQAGRQIGQIRGEVQLLDGDFRLALAGLRKRGALRGGIELAAIELKRQAGRHQHIALGIEAAQKRQADLQVAHRVAALATAGLVQVVHAAAGQRHVVDRKAGGGAGGGVVRRVEALHDVVDVVLASSQVGEVHLGAVNRHRVHHRCQAQQGLQLGIHIHPVYRELGALAIGRCHGQVTHRELQRPWRKFHSTHRDLPPQQRAQAALCLAFEQGGYGRPGQHPQHKQAGQAPRHTAKPQGNSGRK